MNSSTILDYYRQELPSRLRPWLQELPHADPLPISTYLALSLLQKAIRRGKEAWALRAATTLLQRAPSSLLWKRLGIIAYGDIGIADPDAVALVTAAMKGKTYRATLGGEWAVASFIITRMCRAPKCRATDDLFVVAEWHPDLDRRRQEYPTQNFADLMKVAISDAALPERALALWHAAGTNKFPSPQLRGRKGSPDAVLNVLCKRGYSIDMVDVCREGLKKTGEVLPLFLILLGEELRKSPAHVEPDDLPEEVMVGPVPCWANDMFTREGKQAIKFLLESGSEIGTWAEANLPNENRVQIMGGMLSRIESGLVSNRLRWEAADRLRHMADIEIYGIDPKTATEGLAIFRRELPKLQDARLTVVGF